MNSYDRIYENLINVHKQAKKKKPNSKAGRFIGPLSLEYELIGRMIGSKLKTLQFRRKV